MAYLEPDTYSEHCQTSTMEHTFCKKNSYLAHVLAQARNVPKRSISYNSGNGHPE